jgi:hypothetical protein
MTNLQVLRYVDDYKEKWDDLVLGHSQNGTFLQSRRFLEYHGKRFVDHSLLFMSSGNLIAVCPAIERLSDGRKEFISHAGSTFGGFVIGREFYSLTNCIDIVDSFEDYIKKQNFQYCLIKQISDIFCQGVENNAFSYLLFQKGFQSYKEISFALDLSTIADVVANFKSKTRNLYKNSLKNNLELRPVERDCDIQTLYGILCKSLQKYNTKPVHSYEELLDLFHNRISDYMRFYGVYFEGRIIAGSMVFILNHVFHTQYLFADPDYLSLKPMDFMDGTLMQIAFNEKFRYFSFGISTENQGHYLNETLAKFKEGFGTNFYINESFYRAFDY